MSLSASVSPRSPLSPISAMSQLSPRSPRSPMSPISPMSPMSPISPSSKSPYASISFDETFEFKDNESMLDILTKIGYLNANKITDTLQGSIYRANQSQNDDKPGKTVVIKVTDRYLHKHSVSRVIDGSTYKVNEDILLEQSILKYLTQYKDSPHSFVKFERFFETNTDYFLVMEDGGSSLYHFAIKAHRLIKAGRIQLSHWKKVVKIMFKQIFECVAFLHSRKVAHFDISLENILINDVEIQIKTKKKKERVCFVLEDIQIRLCDFGMAQLYSRSPCLSSTFRGKTNYKSPEIINKKKGFDAMSNDVWCMGVCLFMITVGFPPFNKAHKDDPAFEYIMKGELLELLKSWKVLKYFDKYSFGLIDSIFQYEKHRIMLPEMEEHPFIQND